MLANWATSASIQLRQVERVEHIFPSELSVGEGELSQVCLMGVGGRSLVERDVQDSIRSVLDILDTRPLIVLLDDIDDAQVKIAVKLGVHGIISTFLDTEIAIRAISYVFEGGVYFPSAANRPHAAAGHRARDVRNHPSSTAPVAPRYDTPDNPVPRKGLPELSERQMEVLDALTRGYSNKLIARELNLSEATVKIHMRTLIQKFGVENRTQVALLANDPALEIKGRKPSPRRGSDADYHPSGPGGRRPS